MKAAPTAAQLPPAVKAFFKRQIEKRTRELPNSKSIVVLDEAGMVGLSQMAGVVRRLHSVGAKLATVGDHEQLQSIEPGAPFRLLLAELGAAELTTVARQKTAWQATATEQFSQGNADAAEAAIRAYADGGCVHVGFGGDYLTETIKAAEQALGRPLTEEDRSRISMVAQYVASRQEAGTIWHGGLKDADPKSAHPDYPAFQAAQKARGEAARSIDTDIDGCRPWLARYGVKPSDFTADLLAARGTFRDAAKSQAAALAARLGLLSHTPDCTLSVDFRHAARAGLIAAWAADEAKDWQQYTKTLAAYRAADPKVGDAPKPPSSLILAFTRDDVKSLNAAARAEMLTMGRLGEEVMVKTADRGDLQFAPGDRVQCLANAQGQPLQNGLFGTVVSISQEVNKSGALKPPVFLIQFDGQPDPVNVDTATYRQLDYGYSATVHKSQGATVNRVQVLASKFFDRHLYYVALSRHRLSAHVWGASSDFPDLDSLVKSVRQARSADAISDYIDPLTVPIAPTPAAEATADDAKSKIMSTTQPMETSHGPAATETEAEPRAPARLQEPAEVAAVAGPGRDGQPRPERPAASWDGRDPDQPAAAAQVAGPRKAGYATSPAAGMPLRSLSTLPLAHDIKRGESVLSSHAPDRLDQPGAHEDGHGLRRPDGRLTLHTIASIHDPTLGSRIEATNLCTLVTITGTYAGRHGDRLRVLLPDGSERRLDPAAHEIAAAYDPPKHRAPFGSPRFQRSVLAAVSQRTAKSLGCPPALPRKDDIGWYLQPPIPSRSRDRLLESTLAAEVQRRLDAAARLRADPLPRPDPRTLCEFIANRGGIYDPGGNLGEDARFWHRNRRFRPKLIRPMPPKHDAAFWTGPSASHIYSADYVLTAAIEAGFFRADAEVSDLFDAISREAAGKPALTRDIPEARLADNDADLNNRRMALEDAGVDTASLGDDEVMQLSDALATTTAKTNELVDAMTENGYYAAFDDQSDPLSMEYDYATARTAFQPESQIPVPVEIHAPGSPWQSGPVGEHQAEDRRNLDRDLRRIGLDPGDSRVTAYPYPEASRLQRDQDAQQQGTATMKFSDLFSRLFKPTERTDDASSKLRMTELEVRRLEAELAQAQAARALALADIRTKAYGDYLAASGRPAAFTPNAAAALNQYTAEQSVARLRPAAEIEEILKGNREGDLSARVKLAEIMYSGEGIRQDKSAALSLYAAAHRAGSTEATAELNRLATDAGTEQRIRGWAAFSLDRNEQAAELGNPAAAREIADSLRTSNPPLSSWWENRASELARQDHAADMAAREAAPATTTTHVDWASRTLFQRVEGAGWQHVVDARTTYRVAAHDDGGASFVRESRGADGSTIAEDTARFASVGEAADAAIRHAAERRDFRATPTTTAYAYEIAQNAPAASLESSMRAVPMLSERQISKLPDQPYEVILAQQNWKPAEDMNLEHRAGYGAAMSLRPLGTAPEPTAAAEAEARAARWFNRSPAEIWSHARDLLDGETAGYKAGFAGYLSRNAPNAAPMAHLLGRMHADGMGTYRDPAKAAEYFAMAEAGYRSTPSYPPERLTELAADRDRAAAVGEVIHAQPARAAARLWDNMSIQDKESTIRGMWSRDRGDPAQIKTGQTTASAIIALKTSAERIEAAREYMASDAHPVATRVGFLTRISSEDEITNALARDPRPHVQSILASTMAENITSTHYAKSLSHEPNYNRPLPPDWQNDYDRSDRGDYLYAHVRGIEDYGHTPAETADRIRSEDLGIAAAWEREASKRPLAPAEEAERQYAAAYVKHYEHSDEPPTVTAASRERLAQINYLNIAEDSRLERRAGLKAEARDGYDARFAQDHNRPVPPDWYTNYTSSERFEHRTAHVEQWAQSRFGMTAAENADRIRSEDLAIAAAWEHEASKRPLALAEEAERQHAAAYVKHYDAAAQPPAVTPATPERLAALEAFAATETQRIEHRHQARQAAAAPTQTAAPEAENQAHARHRLGGEMKQESTLVAGIIELAAHTAAHTVDGALDAAAKRDPKAKEKSKEAPAGEMTFEEECRQEQARRDQAPGTMWDPDVETAVRWNRAARANAAAEAAHRQEDHDQRDAERHEWEKQDRRERAEQRAPTSGPAPTEPQPTPSAAAGPSVGDRVILAANVQTTTVDLARLSKDEDWQVRATVGRNAATDSKVLASLAKDKEILVKTAVASNEHTPTASLATLSRSREPIVRTCVAGNASTPPELLTTLSADKEMDVRQTVARNEHTPPSALSTLATDKEMEVRAAVADNAATKTETLSVLARDPESSVLTNVARHPNTSPADLTSLSGHYDNYVAQGVAQNLNTPHAVLTEMQKDSNPDIVRSAGITLATQSIRQRYDDTINNLDASTEINQKWADSESRQRLANAQDRAFGFARETAANPASMSMLDDTRRERITALAQEAAKLDQEAAAKAAAIAPAAKAPLAHLDREAAKQATYGMTPDQHAKATDRLADAQSALEAADYPAIKHGAQRQVQLSDPEFVKQQLAEVIRQNQVKDPSHHDHYGPKPGIDAKSAQRAEMLSTLNRATAPSVGAKLDSLLAQSQPATLHQHQQNKPTAGVLGGTASSAAAAKPDADAEAKAAQAAYAAATKNFLANPQDKALAAEYKASCSRLQDTGGVEKIADASEKSRATAAAGMFKADQKDMANRQEIAKTLAPHFPPPKDHFEAELRAAHKDAMKAVETGNAALSQSAAARATAAGVGLLANDKQYQAAKESGAVPLANQYIAKALREKAPHLSLGPAQSHVASL